MLETERLLQQKLKAGELSPETFDDLKAAVELDKQVAFGHRVEGRLVTLQTSLPCYPQLVAVSKVFNTTELLEQILTYILPQHLVLYASPVCKGFKRTIDESSRLRKIMQREIDYDSPSRFFPYRLSGFWTKQRRAIAIDDDKTYEEQKRDVLELCAEIRNWQSLSGSTLLNSIIMIQPPVKIFGICVTLHGYGDDNDRDISRVRVLGRKATEVSFQPGETLTFFAFVRHVRGMYDDICEEGGIRKIRIYTVTAEMMVLEGWRDKDTIFRRRVGWRKVTHG